MWDSCSCFRIEFTYDGSFEILYYGASSSFPSPPEYMPAVVEYLAGKQKIHPEEVDQRLIKVSRVIDEGTLFWSEEV